MSSTAAPQPLLVSEASGPAEEKTVASPFSVIVDSREQHPYTFRENLFANADQHHARIIVPTVRLGLDTGDYSILGLHNLVAVERKSKEDLYSSIGQRRDNFEDRMRRLCLEHSVAAIVVEAEWASLILDPPHHSRLHPKALVRTIMAWMVRWPRVHWILMPDRALAEVATYRFLERFWWAWTDGKWFDAERYQEWEGAGWPGAPRPGDDVTSNQTASEIHTGDGGRPCLTR
jgi:DNA excision repair protein ERCC-4